MNVHMTMHIHVYIMDFQMDIHEFMERWITI